MQKRNLTLLTVLGMIAVAAGLVGIVFLLKPVDKLKFPLVSPPPTDQIAVVGEEVIYVRDLEAELAASNLGGAQTDRDILIEKLVNDSVILQAGKEEGIIELTDEIFNKKDKDYAKRIEAIEEVKRQVSQRGDHIQGAVVSIRFRTNDFVGPLGLEKSREIAFEKMSDLHRRLVSGELTIEQAGELIKGDESLVELDPAWQMSALFHFDARPGDSITLNPDFDANLWILPTGGVTDVYLAKDPVGHPDNPFEAIYYVGQVTARTVSDSSQNVEVWVLNKKETYNVTMF